MARELVADDALRATFQAVAAWPGLDVNEVSQASGLPGLEVQRNLHRLQDAGLIAPIIRGSLPAGCYVTPHGRQTLRLLAPLVADAGLQALLQASSGASGRSAGSAGVQFRPTR